MEKENKYYSIIEGLIKKHRKFSGLEAILEDIIDDVYSHSEVILKTINNEAVINAYLEKVVSTSIITVPKQMNFHAEISHATISTKPIVQEPVKKVDNTLVDKMINSSASIEVAAEVPIVTLNEITELAEPETQVIEEEAFEPDFETVELDTFVEEIPEAEPLELVENKYEQEEVLFESPIEDEDLIQEEDTEPQPEELVFTDTEEDLEEPVESLEEDIIEPQPEELVFTDTEVDLEEPVEALEEDIIEPQPEELVFTDTEVDLEEPVESLEEDIIEPQQEELVFTDTEEDLEEPVESLEEDIIEPQAEELVFTDTEEDLEEPVESLEEDIIEPQPEELVFTDTEEDLEEEEIVDFAEESPDFTLEETDNFEPLEESSETPSEENIDDFVPTDYSAFSFSPTDEDNDSSIDTDLIANDLAELSAKYPDLNIIDIYKLKYKDNLPISEVASKLDISENKVIEALNEIIAVI